jgi:hypothetical protein
MKNYYDIQPPENFDDLGRFLNEVFDTGDDVCELCIPELLEHVRGVGDVALGYLGAPYIVSDVAYEDETVVVRLAPYDGAPYFQFPTSSINFSLSPAIETSLGVSEVGVDGSCVDALGNSVDISGTCEEAGAACVNICQNDDVYSENYVDEAGNPAGGYVAGVGLAINWQLGPLAVDGERHEPNGAFVEGVIGAVIQRIEFYQGSKFHCLANAIALGHLRAALEVLNERTRDREDRGVEGTHTV